jgi:hypothetical protein
MTYKELVDDLILQSRLLQALNGQEIFSTSYAQFGFDYEIGLDDAQYGGANWTYPAFFLTPTNTTIGENSQVIYTFQGTILDQPVDSKEDRTLIYSRLMNWVVAYFQVLDPLYQIEYTSSARPFDINYDAELVGWKFEISIITYVPCVV